MDDYRAKRLLEYDQTLSRIRAKIRARRLAEMRYPSIDAGQNGALCRCWYEDDPRPECTRCNGKGYVMIETIGLRHYDLEEDRPL